jgi:hypothetical protein
MGRTYYVCYVWSYRYFISFNTMKNWIINKWDWWIYLRSLSVLRRMSKSNIGLTYLFELYLREYNQKIHSLPDLKSAIEYFYNSLPQNNED